MLRAAVASEAAEVMRIDIRELAVLPRLGDIDRIVWQSHRHPPCGARLSSSRVLVAENRQPSSLVVGPSLLFACGVQERKRSARDCLCILGALLPGRGLVQQRLAEFPLGFGV